jgi:hypothetical protein
VKPEAQETLAAALQYFRDVMAQKRSTEARSALAHAVGVIDALVSAGELTREEGDERKSKMYDLVDDPSKRRRPQRNPPKAPYSPTGFLKLVPGPYDPTQFLDGFVRIVAVELYQDHLRVHWNLRPLPSYSALLGDDLNELDRDTEGLAEDERERKRFFSRMNRLHRLLRFTATDDVGTKYRHSRGASSGSGQVDELGGVAIFEPALPADAASLRVMVHETEITISIK